MYRRLLLVGELLIVSDEATLRRSLFEHTGGSYPEVVTLLLLTPDDSVTGLTRTGF